MHTQGVNVHVFIHFFGNFYTLPVFFCNFGLAEDTSSR